MMVVKICVLFGLIGLTIAARQRNGLMFNSNKVTYYDLETNENLGPFVRDNNNNNSMSINDTAISQPCKCTEQDCTCCTGLHIKNLNIRHETCSRILYNPLKRMLNVSLIYNDRKLAQKRYSVDGPSPVCAPLPLPAPFTGLVKVCLQLYNFNTEGSNLHVCVDILTHVLEADTPVLVLHFNCFTVGLDGIHYRPN